MPIPVETDADIIVVKRKASFIQFLRDPVQFFRDLGKHDGSLTEISLGNRNFYVVTDPALIRDILSTHGALFEKFPQGNPKQKLFGNGLLTSEGAAQKQQRRMLLPCFHRERLKTYAHEMVSCVARLTASWTTGQRVNLSDAMNDLTLEIIGRTLLGVNDRAVMTELGAQLHTMLSLANRFVVPWGDWLMNLPLPSTLRYRRATARLDQMVFDLIQSTRQNPKPDSLIGILLESKHSDGSPVSDIEIRDEVVTMIVAGHETVAVGLTWSLYLMATHPELQDRLADRVFQTLGNQSPEVDDYPRLEFLQHAFSEALRLHPPIWILGRRNLEDYSFRNFKTPKSSVFLVCMADLHRRASLFDDPESYKPERWLEPQWPAYAFIPFGGGDRRCVGERFAWMEAIFVLACLLNKWRFSAVDQRPPESSAQLTLHPRGSVWLKVDERN